MGDQTPDLRGLAVIAVGVALFHPIVTRFYINRLTSRWDNECWIWARQDLTQLQLDRFAFMVGNSFQHFLTNEDQDRLLRSIHNVLEHDGVFI
ncbi:hypothetical protein [Paenibacillus apiarius]|uniref:hypothetical protein n=1 Tax=Paenibacillus apiarius TaxID=46240 RepID=UPI00197E3394|nr:hypothetical protein [Paenibacillus apiarius]MBN3522523.1 hypothetical protein [Paenibacillus apiarius]